MNMNPSVSIHNSIPDDIAFKIASSLQVFDVCSLGSCSRLWRDLCGSDCVWETLFKERWPAFALDQSFKITQSHDQEQELVFNSKGWKLLYINKHSEMAEMAGSVINFVERALAYDSIEVGNYLRAIELLDKQQFGFKDIQMFLLKPNLNVLVNLVGVHYCIVWLGVPAESVTDALDLNQISERKVCVQWWKLGRWFYGYRLRDELHSRNVSLADLATCNEEVMAVLHRGAIHEVIRVQISAAKPAHTSWSFQVAEGVST